MALTLDLNAAFLIKGSYSGIAPIIFAISIIFSRSVPIFIIFGQGVYVTSIITTSYYCV